MAVVTVVADATLQPHRQNSELALLQIGHSKKPQPNLSPHQALIRSDQTHQSPVWIAGCTKGQAGQPSDLMSPSPGCFARTNTVAMMNTKPTMSIQLNEVPSHSTANKVAETVSMLATMPVFVAPISLTAWKYNVNNTKPKNRSNQPEKSNPGFTVHDRRTRESIIPPMRSAPATTGTLP